MDKYCSNCGNKLDYEADVCLKCGKLINKSKIYQKGKGRSIASMILGIVACFFTLIMVLNFNETNNEIIYYTDFPSIIAYLIGYSIFSLPTSITGLCLSISGIKIEKSGFNISGVILNSISLIIVTIIILCHLTYAI